ncbi:MAG: tetratricopeptide repeat protein [Gemmatales bacterium]
MALDAYSACLCGSGKKFKWCCAPFFDLVEKAYAQERNKQHEVALRMMLDVSRQHAKNSAVWCYLADLYMLQGKFDEANTALDEALKLDSQNAKALYLKAAYLHESERADEALSFYRKAADACDPAAVQMMADIHIGIAQCETIRNHPFAAKAAIDVAHRCDPSSESIQDFINRYYGVRSEYPAIVRKNHPFKKMIKKDALPLDVQQATQGGKLGKLHQLMEGLVQRLSYDPAFFYNLGLSRAWVGENQSAVEALDEYVRQASNDAEAAEAWALAEAIRLDGGKEEESDYPLYFVNYQVPDVRRFIEKVQHDKRLVDATQNEMVVQFNRLDRDMPAFSETLALFELPRVHLRFILHLGAGVLMGYSLDPQTQAQAHADFQAQYGALVVEKDRFTQPGTYLHISQSVFDVRLPQGFTPEQSERLLKEKIRSHFEDRWAHRSLHSLQGNTPIDAVGHPILRRKVMGCITILEQVMNQLGAKLPYSMDELRHKLSLDQAGSATEGEAPAATTSITAMNNAELAAIAVDSASEEELKQAFTTARRLDANELATKFAQALVNQAANKQDADCFIYDQHIIYQLLGEDRVERAYVNILKALERDAKLNAGRRSLDYRKLRLKVLLAGKRVQEARADLDKLLAEKGEDLDLFVFATEELLRFGHKELAGKYAGMGKLVASRKNDRDRLSFFESMQKKYGSEK